MFFLTSLQINIKRLFKPYLLIPIIFLFASLATGAYVQKRLEVVISIGVFDGAKSELSKDVISNLYSFSNIDIIEYDNFESMIDALMWSRIESAYEITEGMDKYIENGAINRTVKVYKTENNISEGFTNELFFASLLKTAAPYISTGYLNLSGEDVDIEQIKSQINEYYEDGVFMGFDILYMGQGGKEHKNVINTGIVAVFLFTLFFYTAIKAAAEKKRGYYLRLPNKEQFLFVCSYICAAGVLAIPVSLAATPFIGSYGIVRSLIGVVLYIAGLVVLCCAAAVLINSPDALYAVFPIVSAAVIILGGAFFDIGIISPLAGKISYLFPTYYFTRFLY